MDNRPIGVFDSGLGGLTVAKEIMTLLKNEKLVYFGDTARVPYGSKSKETVIKFSNQISRFLKTKDVKAIVIACGTASALALEDVRKSFDSPIIGVVEPGARAASLATKNKKVGIIGTRGTISSKTYEVLIHQLDPNINVKGIACPLFVPLVEEGWIDDEVTYQVATKYLKTFKDSDIDTLVLGCTHYPLLTNLIQDIMGNHVTLVNPAYETAKELEKLLETKQLQSEVSQPSHKFYVSDQVHIFEDFAKIILDQPMLPVQHIQIENY